MAVAQDAAGAEPLRGFTVRSAGGCRSPCCSPLGAGWARLVESEAASEQTRGCQGSVKVAGEQVHRRQTLSLCTGPECCLARAQHGSRWNPHTRWPSLWRARRLLLTYLKTAQRTGILKLQAWHQIREHRNLMNQSTGANSKTRGRRTSRACRNLSPLQPSNVPVASKQNNPSGKVSRRKSSRKGFWSEPCHSRRGAERNREGQIKTEPRTTPTANTSDEKHPFHQKR